MLVFEYFVRSKAVCSKDNESNIGIRSEMTEISSTFDEIPKKAVHSLERQCVHKRRLLNSKCGYANFPAVSGNIAGNLVPFV